MVVVLGMAGSGKTTLCKALEKSLNYRWVSMSDMLRRHATKDILDSIASGNMVSDKDLMPILYSELGLLGDSPEVLLDGCPRTIEEAEHFTTDVRLKTRLVLHLQIDEAVAIERLMERRRSDDTPDAIRRRVDEYYETISDILSLFELSQVKVCHIPADSTPEKVLAEARKVLV
jgi:adenylate kinase